MKVLPLSTLPEALVEASSQTVDRPRRNRDQAHQDKKNDTGSKRQGFKKSQESSGTPENVSREETSQPLQSQIVDSQKLINLLSKKPSASKTAKKNAFQKLAVKSVTSSVEEKIKKV